MSNFLNSLFGSLGKRPVIDDMVGGWDYTSKKTTTSNFNISGGSDKLFKLEIDSVVYLGENHVIIAGDAVIIDGVKIPVSFDNDKRILEIKVLEGSITNLICSANLTAGTVLGTVDVSGDAHIDTVNANVDVMGNLEAKTISGSVDAMGSVSAGTINGSVEAMGNINIGK